MNEAEKRQRREAVQKQMANVETAIAAWDYYLTHEQPENPIDCMQRAKLEALVWVLKQQHEHLKLMLREL